MAVKTGEIFNSLVFGGVNSADYGIYITGEGVFNAPKRAVNMVAVPGRNGSIAIDQGHWENIEVTYPAGTFGMDEQEFRTALSDFRNAIASQVGYQRLTDTYHPDEYRMAIYMDGLEVEPTTYNKAGKFELKFNCKPQRWLTSGEVPVTIGEWGATKTASGEIVTIESEGGEAAKSLEVSLEPIQDLNGYDKPWVGGAGKNKLNLPDGTFSSAGVTATVKDGVITFSGTATADGWIRYRTGFSLEGGTYTLKDFANKTASGTAGTRFQIISSSGGNFTLPWASALDGHATVTATTASDFEMRTRITSGVDYNGVVIKPMLVSGSTAPTMFEPYENICPISGRTAVGVSRIGANCLNLSDRVITSVGVTATVKDGVITFSGTATADGWIRYGSASLRGGTYTLTALANRTVTGVPGTRFQIYSASGGNLNVYWALSADASVTATVSTANDYTLRTRISNGKNYDGIVIKPMLVIGSTAPTSYEPYNGNTYTTALGRTVYGGTLDVVSGVLTVTHGMVDMGSLNWTKLTDVNVFYADIQGGPLAANGGNDGLCSIYPIFKGQYSAMTDKAVTIANRTFSNTQGRTAVKDTSYSSASASDFKTAISGQQLVYELATPQTYQLTPQQIGLLLGENHLWSDGAITMQYGDDPNSLWNPTQYDAGPLLAIEGNGNISFNGYTVVVDAGEYGLINVKGTKILSDPITYSTKTELYNSGDTIEIYLELHWELISARSPRATRVSNLQNTGDGQTETQPFSNGSLKGTTIIDTFFLSSQDTTLTNVFSCDVEFSNGHTATTTLTLEVVWDSANSTLSFHTTPSGHGRWGRVVRTYPTSIIEAVSSKTYLGNPTYVDCELGEAYKIEDGEIVSLNKYIELGSDLPKLSSGANDVTISDTVTELKVTPNWWKL